MHCITHAWCSMHLRMRSDARRVYSCTPRDAMYVSRATHGLVAWSLRTDFEPLPRRINHAVLLETHTQKAPFPLLACTGSHGLSSQNEKKTCQLHPPIRVPRPANLRSQEHRTVRNSWPHQGQPNTQRKSAQPARQCGPVWRHHR